MTVTDTERAKLIANAARHQPNPVLERACQIWDSGDREAYNRLPRSVRAEADIWRDFRDAHRQAVEAGVITDDTAA